MICDISETGEHHVLKDEVYMGRVYPMKETRGYMKLEIGKQTIESHVEFRIYLQEKKRLLIALTMGVNQWNFQSGYSGYIVENEFEGRKQRQEIY